MRVRNTVAIAMFAAISCSCRSELWKDLERESATHGLALVSATGNQVDVIPFDKNDVYFQAPYQEPLSVVYGKAGKMVGWYGHPIRAWLAGRMAAGDFVIKTMEGEAISNSQPPFLLFFPEALSETARRVAFNGTLPGKPKSGLYWAPFGFADTHFVGEVDGPTCCDWSPDGSSLVYENRGQIFLFNVSTVLSKPLGYGIEPNWSPDGKSIAFRAPNGQASLMTTTGESINWPIRDHKPISGIRWSPDGLYVAFAEPVKVHVPIFGANARLVVARVSDGRAITVTGFSAFSPTYSDYHWIVNYRSFLQQARIDGLSRE